LASAGVLLLAPGSRGPVWISLGLGALLQLPLGWWLVRSVGSPRFLLPWVLGMLARLAGLAAMGLLLAPAWGWNAQAPMVALVLLFTGMLVVEAWVLWTEQFGTRG
jgi:hypothetical protein